MTRGGEAGPPRPEGPSGGTGRSPVNPSPPSRPASAALTRRHHRPPPDRVIEQAGAVAQEAKVAEPGVGQLGRGQAPGLVRQELQGLSAWPSTHHDDAVPTGGPASDRQL